MTRLRPLEPADLERVEQLESELFGPAAWSRALYTEELARVDRYYVAAEVDGEIVGYAGIVLAADAQVMTVGVAVSHRRQGIATRLVEDLLERARTARARDVFLEVRAGDGGAQELYRRAGFEPIGVRPRYYPPDGEDAVVMHRRLRPAATPLGG